MGIKGSENTSKDRRGRNKERPSLARFRVAKRGTSASSPCFRCFANFLAAQFARSPELPRDKQH